jgi:hypothetical protein
MKKEPLTMKNLITGEYEKCKNSVEYFICNYTNIPTNKILSIHQQSIIDNIGYYLSPTTPSKVLVLKFLRGDEFKVIAAYCLWKIIVDTSVDINIESSDPDIKTEFFQDVTSLNASLPRWLTRPSYNTEYKMIFRHNDGDHTSTITSLGKITKNELELNINNSDTMIFRGLTTKKEEPSKERRVINIPKEQFDIIQKHCDANSLDMAKWMVNNSTSLINQPTTYPMITSEQAKARQLECESETIPVNWLYIVMKEINDDILFASGTKSSDKFIYWGGVCETKTKYGHYAFYDLNDDRIRLLKLELNKYGYILERDLTTYTKAMRYKISW